VVEAVRHCRAVMGAIKQLQTLDEDEIYVYAKVRNTTEAVPTLLFPDVRIRGKCSACCQKDEQALAVVSGRLDCMLMGVRS
jgi:pyridoxal biosynthesis lyase PdxS